MPTTLYKKDTKGKIREWTIEQNGDKYRTIAGIKDGKLVTSEWMIALPKNVGKANATTGEQQAAAEIESEVRKKKEKNYVENVSEVDNQVFESPMLAKSFDDYREDLSYPVYSQPKLDGIRCIVTEEGMVSRNDKKFVSCPHIHKALINIFDKIRKKFPSVKSIKFDGELYNHKLKHNFDRICELVKKLKPTEEDLKESEDIIQFWCYDLDIPGLTFTERFTILTQALKEYNKKSDCCIVVVPTYLVQDEDELTKYYEQHIADGYEGQIIRNPKACYQNKRTKDLLKRKEFKDGEWPILGVVEGEGNRTGTAGYMQFKTSAGKDFRSNIKGPFAWLKKLLKNKDELIGKMATIKYFNLTPDGVPRFPYVIAIRDYE